MMKMKKTEIDLIIWDLDGTLLNTTLYIVQNWIHLYEKRGRKPLSLEEMIYFSGPPLEALLKEKFPEEDTEALVREFDEFSLKNANKYSFLYPDEIRVLDALKDAGYRMALLTSKRKEAAVNNLKHWGLDRYLEMVVCCDELSHPKPDPEGVNRILTALNFSPERAIAIGDSISDLEAGKRAGVKTGFASWGLKKVGKVESDMIFADFNDIERSLL